MNDELFCVGQKAIINKKGKVLILHDPVIDKIDIPGGKIQESEKDFICALKREVYEETGLKISKGRPFFTSYFEFSSKSSHHNAGKKIYLVFFMCKYKSGEVKLSEEHDWYKWVNKNNFSSYFKSKTNIYEVLSDYFNIFSNASLSDL